MGRKAEYTVLITNPAGSSVVETVEAPDARTGKPGFTDIKASPRLNEAGHGSFTATATPDLLDAVNTPENRVVIRREADDDGDLLIQLAGPIELPDDGYDARRDGTRGHGVVTVNFADDIVRLADRLVYPSPTLASTAQTVVARYSVSAGNTEDAMRTLVNAQAASGAPLSYRRLPGLVLGTDHGLTATMPATSFTRDTNVADALRDMSLLSTVQLGFRIIPAGGQLLFDVYAPQDLTETIFFGRDMGNIVDYRYAPEAPLDTVAIVGDAAAGTGRVIKERVNQAALDAGWLRKEVFVDARGAANATELEQAGDEHLAENGPKRPYSVTAVETPLQRYGYDLAVGDRVTGETNAGLQIAALIQGADITYTPKTGEDVRLLIGDLASYLAAQAAELRNLKKRMAQLEGAL